MKNHELIKYEAGLIERVNNVVSVTNKLLETTHPQLIPYRKKDKWGFCTPDKKIIVDCIYNEALPFEEGLAAVNKNGKWGYIGETGREIIECKYDRAFSFNEGLGIVSLNYQRGFIDKTGSSIIPCRYLGINSFSNGLIAVREFTPHQKTLLKLKLVSSTKYFHWLEDIKNEDKKYGYIDRSGKEIIPAIYISAGNFNEGLAVVKMNSNFGFIDEKGEEVIPFKFYKASSFNEKLAAVKIFNSPKSTETSTMYIDRSGEVKLTCTYDDIYGFHEGLAQVEINGNSYIGKSGFIDKTGKEIINCKYDHASSFSEGLAAVALNDKYLFSKYGYIDKNDRMIIPLKYEDANNFKNGLARVRLNGVYGYINQKGIEYWED